MKGCTTPPRSKPPTLYEEQCGFFYVPKESGQWKLTYKTGPTGFCPYIYLRRLEWLTICRCHNKGSTLSGRGLNPWPPTQQSGTYPTELTGWWLIMIELLLNSICRVSMLQTASYDNKFFFFSRKKRRKSCAGRIYILRNCWVFFFLNLFWKKPIWWLKFKSLLTAIFLDITESEAELKAFAVKYLE